jgi:hypothetical protein
VSRVFEIGPELRSRGLLSEQRVGREDDPELARAAFEMLDALEAHLRPADNPRAT